MAESSSRGSRSVRTAAAKRGRLDKELLLLLDDESIIGQQQQRRRRRFDIA